MWTFGEVNCTGVDFQEEFPRHQAEVLFGKDFTVNEAFNLLDYDNDGQVTCHISGIRRQ